jgi:tetratricopeptide (TPR) repeat protein
LCFEGTQDLETTPGDAEIALEMLRFFSFLHGDEITENVMLSAAQYFQTETRKRNPAQNPHFTFLALDLDKLKDASRRCRALLANFSLLQGQSLTRLGTEGMHYSMHVMIKHCVKIHLNRANEEEKYWRKALFTIADALSFKPSHRAYSAVLQRTSIAHIDECIGDRKLNGYAEDSELDNAWLLFGRVYCENRRVDAAARLRTEVVDHAGYEHDNKRRAENDLAISLRDQGKYKKALETRRRLLMESEERCKGATTLHLHKKLRDQVCSAKLNLADSLGDYDEYFEAVTFQEEAWAERKELLGKEDPKTLKAHRRLANSYNRIGDSVKALSLRQSIVDILGDQGSTKYEQEALYAYSDLADSLDDMGDLQGAWALRDRVYRRREEIDGSQKSLHYVALDLLTARFNCATSRGRLKILEDDVILEERIALREEYRERFGAESRDALKALTALGNCYRRMNKKDQALKVLSEALELTQRIWPPNCSAILNRLSDVISIKIAMLPKGQVSEELIAERKEIVKRWEQRGSQWTRQIWEARNRLADLYSLFGQHTEALEERSQIEKEQERKLEADDPGLLRTRFRMAKDLSRESQKLQGTVRNRKELDAMDLYRRVCQDSTKSHRLKMAAMRALIDNLMPKNPEEYSEYTKYLHDLLPLQIKFLGKEHPDTDRTQRQYDLLQPNPDDPPTDTESYNSADDTHEDQSKNARTTGNPPSPKGTSTTDFSNHKMQDMKTSEVYP